LYGRRAMERFRPPHYHCCYDCGIAIRLHYPLVFCYRDLSRPMLLRCSVVACRSAPSFFVAFRFCRYLPFCRCSIRFFGVDSLFVFRSVGYVTVHLLFPFRCLFVVPLCLFEHHSCSFYVNVLCDYTRCFLFRSDCSGCSGILAYLFHTDCSTVFILFWVRYVTITVLLFDLFVYCSTLLFTHLSTLFDCHLTIRADFCSAFALLRYCVVTVFTFEPLRATAILGLVGAVVGVPFCAIVPPTLPPLPF